MIGLLVPLRWWRGGGTPTYSEAPERRYVWAPPEVRLAEAHPLAGDATADPYPGAALDADLRDDWVAAESRVSTTPPENRGSTA